MREKPRGYCCKPLKQRLKEIMNRRQKHPTFSNLSQLLVVLQIFGHYFHLHHLILILTLPQQTIIILIFHSAYNTRRLFLILSGGKIRDEQVLLRNRQLHVPVPSNSVLQRSLDMAFL